ncbi:MAG: phage tail protein [Angustibacter sp.]
MALDSSKVRVAVTGVVSVAPTGTAAPTNASASLNAAFLDLGYISEDGITEARERSTEDLKAWQNGTTVRTVVTEGSLTFNFRMLETNKPAIELAYGATVTQTAAEGSFVVIPTSTGGRKSFVFDVVDGSELRRIYVPQGEVTEVGEISYVNGEPIGYEVTVAAYADATLGGSAKVFATALKS